MNLGPKPRVGGSFGGGVNPPGADDLHFFNSNAVQPPSFQPGPSSVQLPSFQPGPSSVQPLSFYQGPSSGVQPPNSGVFPPTYQSPAAGSMGTKGGPTVQPWQQPAVAQPARSTSYNDEDIENEPPILEELGINVENIVLRMKGIALFKTLDADVLRDADLSGPIVIIMALGMCLLLRGKMQFGYIYGLSLVGCIGVWGLINLMSLRGGIDLYGTTSTLIYGLIPICLLAFIGIFLSLRGHAGLVIAGVCIFWATASSSRFFASGFLRPEQKWLVAYPVGLFYTCFTLLAVF